MGYEMSCECADCTSELWCSVCDANLLEESYYYVQAWPRMILVCEDCKGDGDA